MKILGVLPLALIVIIISHVPVARGVKCLACADVLHGRDCAFVQECSPHQMCSGELFVTPGGFPRYKVGCKDKSTCGSATAEQGTTNLVVCSECCDTPLCNSQLCQDKGYGPRSSRGPVCYNCQNQSDPAHCDKVKTCSVDETCGVIETRVNAATPSTYRILCVAKSICPALQATGKCTGCCDHDLCTNNCTAHNATVTVQATGATATAPTTQTTASTTLIPSTAQPIVSPLLSNAVGSASSGCVDDAACASLVAMYQPINKDVCSDPAIGATYCMKTCGLCTTPAPTTTTITTTATTTGSSSSGCVDDAACASLMALYRPINKDVCADAATGTTYCRKTCGLCTTPAPTTTTPTTPATTTGSSKSSCVDDAACASLVAMYRPINKDVCSDPAIAATYCMKTCGWCRAQTTSTTTPTTIATTGPPSTTCADDAACAVLMALYQPINKDVCANPAVGTTYCRKTCGQCSAPVPTTPTTTTVTGSTVPTYGPELGDLMVVGARVVRGKDWNWGDQDNNSVGTVIDVNGNTVLPGWVRVQWANGYINLYRMGAENKYDLMLA